MTEQFSSLGWNILFTMEMLGECIKVKRTIIPSLYYLWHAIDGMWGGGIKLVRGSHDVDSSSPYCHLFSRRTWWWRKTTPSLFPLGWSEKTEKERSLLADFFFFFSCSPTETWIYKFDMDVFLPDAENERISQNWSHLCWSDQQWALKKKKRKKNSWKHGVLKGLENLSKLPLSHQ